VGKLVRIDARSLIAHLDPMVGQRDRDNRSGRRGVDGILDHVAQRKSQMHRVGRRGAAIADDPEIDATVACGFPHFGDDFIAP
jgi:hypothetical protein